jgi:hypothetical protein
MEVKFSLIERFIKEVTKFMPNKFTVIQFSPVCNGCIGYFFPEFSLEQVLLSDCVKENDGRILFVF